MGACAYVSAAAGCGTCAGMTGYISVTVTTHNTVAAACAANPKACHKLHPNPWPVKVRRSAACRVCTTNQTPLDAIAESILGHFHCLRVAWLRCQRLHIASFSITSSKDCLDLLCTLPGTSTMTKAHTHVLQVMPDRS